MYYSYSAAQWLLVFYLYCMLGWCFESSVVSVGQRRLVNRGFLRGPMLPIYGFGAVILLHVSLPLKQHPVWLYLASMIAATVFEYIVGVVMEKIFKVKYWDYSKQPFNLNGYICLRFSIAWGLACLFVVKLLHPSVLLVIRLVPRGLGWTLLALLAAVLCCAMLTLGGWALVLAALAVLWRYHAVACKQFGGITGDLAGWFLQKTEIWMLAALCACQWGGLL